MSLHHFIIHTYILSIDSGKDVMGNVYPMQFFGYTGFHYGIFSSAAVHASSFSSLRVKMEVLCTEYYGSKGSGTGGVPEVYTYNVPVAVATGRMVASGTGSPTDHAVSLVKFVKTVFLPQGYPDSVSKDYLDYQMWDTLQAFCSSITGTLATQAVLKGSGVGDESANVTSATITWLLKDGTGMVGRIAFAYFKGASLDCDAKRWRMFADVLNDCAIFVQLTAPLWPRAYFTPVMCVAGLAFSLVGVAGGCTRAALTMHQAKRDNMADVSAKDGSQETLVNLAGLLVNLFLTPMVTGNTQLTWILFTLFTFLHIYANYRAVSSVVMETFNISRVKVLVHHFCSQLGRSDVLTPKEANAREPIFALDHGLKIILGCRLEKLNLRSQDFTATLQRNLDTKYLLRFDEKRGVCYICLRDNASAEDVIRACCAAEMSWFQKSGRSSIALQPDLEFVKMLGRSGWDLSKHLLCADEWRWSTDQLDKME